MKFRLFSGKKKKKEKEKEDVQVVSLEYGKRKHCIRNFLLLTSFQSENAYS